MLKRVHIHGLGPHLDFHAELDPRGPTTVSGPSEVGKTFLIEAVLFALYGRSIGGRFQPEAIHDDATRASVELTLDSGRIIRRSITRSRSQTRAIQLADHETKYSTEVSFQEALGDLGRDPEAVQVALVPLLWQELVQGNARKLRDLLNRVLPGGDPAAEVQKLAAEAGIDVSEREAGLDEKAVSRQRREARRLRDEAAGRLELARERLAALEGGAVDEVPVEEPDASLVQRVDAWAAFEAVAGQAQAREAAERAQGEWDRRRAALGDPPTAPDDAAGANARLQTAQQQLQAAWQQAQQLQAQLQQQQMQLQMFSGGDTCPMCQRPGWEQGAAFAEQVQVQVQTLQQQATAAQEQAQAAQAEVAAATEAAEQARGAQAAVVAHRQALAALGARPEVPEIPDDAPARPQGEPPTAEQRAQVASWRRQVETAARLEAERAADLEQARASVSDETERLTRESAEAERLDTLLDLVRRAPSLVATEQLRTLGDLSPVAITFGDNPAVTVAIDGRPWWLASRGRQVVADAVLRSAIRRALEMPWLPLFVDNIQDVGGQPLPELAPPVVWLQTTDGKGIFVRRRSARSDSTLGD